MTKPKNHGKDWTTAQEKKLEKLAKQGKSTATIAKELGRTVSSIYNKADKENISLKPKD